MFVTAEMARRARDVSTTELTEYALREELKTEKP
jgi:hypothetical protein